LLQISEYQSGVASDDTSPRTKANHNLDGYRLSVICYRLSDICFPLSVIGCPLSDFCYPISGIGYPFFVIAYSLQITKNYQFIPITLLQSAIEKFQAFGLRNANIIPYQPGKGAPTAILQS